MALVVDHLACPVSRRSTFVPGFSGAFLGSLFGTSPQARRIAAKWGGRIILGILVLPFLVLTRLGMQPDLAMQVTVALWVSVLLFLLLRLMHKGWQRFAPWVRTNTAAWQKPHWPRHGARATAVYYLRDADGLLLYVGIAFDPWGRWEQHKADPKKRHWIWRVKNVQGEDWYETYSSREEAKYVETQVITGQRGPRPFYNVAEAATV